jgi:hypothetical protein
MKAFVSGSNNEFFGNFEIQSEQELTEELKKFLVSNPMVPKFSYIEMESKTWTIVNLDPLQLVSGIIREEIVKNKKNNTNRKKALLYLLSIPVLFIIGIAIILINIQPTDLRRETNMYQDSNESEKTKQESPTQNYGSPESQFTQYQKDRMGPNYDIVNVIMNLHKVDGKRMVYKGFYTFQIRGTTHKDTSFFFANFENGRLTGWLPDK